jgi:inorganic pyrophosphatase/exopolyphosphatase
MLSRVCVVRTPSYLSNNSTASGSDIWVTAAVPGRCSTASRRSTLFFGALHHLIYICYYYSKSGLTESYSFSSRSKKLLGRSIGTKKDKILKQQSWKRHLDTTFDNSDTKIMENQSDTVSSTKVQQTLAHFLDHMYDHTVAHSSAEIGQASCIPTNSSPSNYRYHVIVGNQAGDCDSIISALTYAYIQQQHQQMQLRKSLNAPSTSSPQLETPNNSPLDENMDNSTIIYIPLIPFPRDDMILRHDVTLLLEHCGVQNLQKLLFVNDPIVTDYILQPKHLEGITLVDHNKLQANPYLRGHPLSSYVVEILDHHLDEGEHTETVLNRNIAFHNGLPSVGSCCTLVGERWLHYYNTAIGMTERNKADHSNQVELELDPGVSLALLGTIVLDTINMDKGANRGTPRDQYVLDQLMYHTNWSSKLLPHITDFYSASNNWNPSPSFNTQPLLSLQRIHEHLRNAKFDPIFWNELSVIDCLRMDYKEFQSKTSINDQEDDVSSFGISSILIPLQQLERNERFLEHMHHFMQERNIKLLAVMSLSFLDVEGKKVPRREIMIITFNQKTSDMMIAALLHQSSMLQLTELTDHILYNLKPSELIIRKFLQGNTSISRKGIAPIMLKSKF